ncbi:MAG: GAF domain-containing protein, partial [Anaerolineales bacterium]|nr:GAF domain-containing protein [Anaerolineales bacterium]
MSRAVSATELRSSSAAPATLSDRLLEWTVLAVLIVTVAIYAITPYLALTWWRQPFLGAFVEKTFIFNGVGDPADPAWSARAVIPDNNQLLAVDGVPVTDSQGLRAALAGREAGDVVTVTSQSQAGVTRTDRVTLSAFPLSDLIQFFVLPYLIGVVYLVFGGWVFRLRGGEPAGRAFALTCALTAIVTGGLFDLYTTHVFTWAWTIAIPNIGAAALVLALIFPQTASPVARRPLLRLIGFLPGLLLAGYALFTLYAPGTDPRGYVLAWRLGYYCLGAGLLSLIGLMLYRWRSNPSPVVSSQSRIIFFGTVAGFASLLIWVVRALVLGQTPVFSVLFNLAPILLFPVAVAYAILRYRLLDTDVVVGQALAYAVIGAVTVAGYSLIIAGLSLLTGAALRADDPFVLGLVVFLLVLAFNRLRERTQQLINRAFFRGSRSYTRRLEQFARTVTQAAGLTEITLALQDALLDVLRPAHVHVFLRDRSSEEYAAQPEATGQPTTDLRFSADGPLALHLASERLALVLSPDQPLPARLTRERARLAVLGSALFVPLPGKSGLTGWLAVGPKLSGEPFQPDDLRFVDSLADQAALAIERAAVISDLERRVKELNVVSQMSQAVSFTRAYDDLLELVYAQVSKIVETRNYTLLLKDRRGGVQAAFVVENDERLTEREGKPADTAGLEAEVLRTGQSIRADDYTEACHRRGVTPGAKLFRAWLGAPLNAGAETLGALIVAAADPTVIFSDDQAKVVATIADQAASALTRARLLQQAEQRARQLATLNEVSLTIASTLELDPLLQRIVQSAANILNCEAGSLFLTDPDTGESVFRVATGPVGQNLVGMRVAPGRGFVGEAIESGRPVIVNDAQSDPRWFRGTDQSTGFITHALITVPLRYQGRPIGAIQLINKRDGAPFDDDDQSLLIAFATPAAIAIENARLFTQTDQALAARVEELSVMQRIGRELNTTLDTDLVANITLSWAMKNTGATAGWVGLAYEKALAIIECEGYGAAEARLRAEAPALDSGLAARVLEAGEPVRVPDTHAERPALFRLDSTRSLLAVPIKREGQAVGLVALESIQPDHFT